MKPEIQERIDAIKELYEPGMSALSITMALCERGFDVSRNAVIGMYTRYGDNALKDCPLLPQGVNRSRAVGKPRGPYNVKPRDPKPPRPKASAKPKQAKASNVVPFALPAGAFTYVATAPTKPLRSVPDGECKWAISGDGFDAQFCAQETTGRNVSYCDHHRRLSVGQGTKSERMAARALRKMA